MGYEFVADYCWNINRDTNVQHKRKTSRRLFILIFLPFLTLHLCILRFVTNLTLRLAHHYADKSRGRA